MGSELASYVAMATGVRSAMTAMTHPKIGNTKDRSDKDTKMLGYQLLHPREAAQERPQQFHL